VREKQRTADLQRRMENKHRQQLEDLQAATDSRVRELEQIQVCWLLKLKLKQFIILSLLASDNELTSLTHLYVTGVLKRVHLYYL